MLRARAGGTSFREEVDFNLRLRGKEISRTREANQGTKLQEQRQKAGICKVLEKVKNYIALGHMKICDSFKFI